MKRTQPLLLCTKRPLQGRTPQPVRIHLHQQFVRSSRTSRRELQLLFRRLQGIRIMSWSWFSCGTTAQDWQQAGEGAPVHSKKKTFSRWPGVKMDSKEATSPNYPRAGWLQLSTVPVEQNIYMSGPLPGNSKVFNPIENLRSVFKRQINKQKATNSDKLQAVAAPDGQDMTLKLTGSVTGSWKPRSNTSNVDFLIQLKATITCVHTAF